MQQHAATIFAQPEDAAGADLPKFDKDEFEALLECGVLVHGFRRRGAMQVVDQQIANLRQQEDRLRMSGRNAG